MSYQWHVKPWIVQLSAGELKAAEMIGIARERSAQDNSRELVCEPPEHGSERSVYNDVMGAQAEQAAAKALNLYWHASIEYDAEAVDVGGLFEVRATDRKNGSLIMYPKDRKKQHLPFILVQCQLPWFKCAGWMWGWEAMTDQFKDPGRANGGKLRTDQNWLVPEKALRPMDEIVVRRVSEKQMS